MNILTDLKIPDVDVLGIAAAYGAYIILIGFFIFAIVMLYRKFNNDFPKRTVLAFKNGNFQFGERREYGTMLVTTKEILDGILFKKPVIGQPVDEYSEFGFIQKTPLGHKITNFFMTLKEKNVLLPLNLFNIEGKHVISLGLKILTAKEIAARYVNEQKKTKEFTDQVNPLATFISTYLFAVIVFFVLGLIVLAIFFNFNSSVVQVVEQLKEVALIVERTKSG